MALLEVDTLNATRHWSDRIRITVASLPFELQTLKNKRLSLTHLS